MKWFKHYANCGESFLLSTIVEEMGMEGYGIYWTLLEKLCSNFDGQSTSFIFRKRTVKKWLRLRTDVKLTLLSRYMDDTRSLSLVVKEDQIFIEAPIILNLQGRDYKKTRSVRAETALEEKRIEETRLEEKPRALPCSFDSIGQIFSDVCAGQGNIKHSTFSGSKITIDNYIVLSGYPEFQTKEQWTEYFTRVTKSDFLKGQSGKFTATLPWLMKSENAEKVLSGQYDNTTSLHKFEENPF